MDGHEVNAASEGREGTPPSPTNQEQTFINNWVEHTKPWGELSATFMTSDTRSTRPVQGWQVSLVKNGAMPILNKQIMTPQLQDAVGNAFAVVGIERASHMLPMHWPARNHSNTIFIPTSTIAQIVAKDDTAQKTFFESFKQKINQAQSRWL